MTGVNVENNDFAGVNEWSLVLSPLTQEQVEGHTRGICPRLANNSQD